MCPGQGAIRDPGRARRVPLIPARGAGACDSAKSLFLLCAPARAGWEDPGALLVWFGLADVGLTCADSGCVGAGSGGSRSITMAVQTGSLEDGSLHPNKGGMC